MQKIRSIALVAVALGSAAFFRTPPVAREAARNPVQRMPAFEGIGSALEKLGHELKLTEAQREKLGEVTRDLERQANDIRQDNSLSNADKEGRLRTGSQ